VLPPDEQAFADAFHRRFFKQWNTYARRWMGVRIVKYPQDLFLYHDLIYQNKPDIIIESGAYLGGGSIFFASMCDLVGHGHVLSVDRRDLPGRPAHPRLTYIIGRTTAVDTQARIRDLVKDKTVMVVLDSDHRSAHVKRELTHYGPMVTPGQFLVVEDTMLGTVIPWKYSPDSPAIAVQWYLARHPEFEVVPLEDRYLVSMAPGGWLRRKT